MAELDSRMEELLNAFQRMNEEIRLTGAVTENTRNELARAGTGLTDFAKSAEKAGGQLMNSAGRVAGNISNVGSSLLSGMMDGTKGATAMSRAASSTASALSEATSSILGGLAMIVPGTVGVRAGLFGLSMALQFLTKGAVDYAQAVLSSSDQLYKTYADLGKMGAAGSEGMTGLYDDLKKLGLSIEQSSEFAEVLSNNVRDLVMFNGGIMNGRKQLVGIADNLKDVREDFMRLGYSVRDQLQSNADFIRSQTAVGKVNKRTADDLYLGAKEYLLQQDLLTRALGMGRKEQEAAADKIRSQEFFQAMMLQLAEQGEEGKKTAANMTQLFKMLEKTYGEEIALGTLENMISGTVMTEASTKALRVTQGESMRLGPEMRAGLAPEEAFVRLQKSIDTVVKSLGPSLGYTQQYGKILGSLEKQVQAGKMDIESNFEAARKTQTDILKGLTDPTLESYAKLMRTSQESNKTVEDFVVGGMKKVLDSTISAHEFMINNLEQVKRYFSGYEKFFDSVGKVPSELKAVVANVQNADIVVKDAEIKLMGLYDQESKAREISDPTLRKKTLDDLNAQIKPLQNMIDKGTGYASTARRTRAELEKSDRMQQMAYERKAKIYTEDLKSLEKEVERKEKQIQSTEERINKTKDLDAVRALKNQLDARVLVLDKLKQQLEALKMTPPQPPVQSTTKKESTTTAPVSPTKDTKITAPTPVKEPLQPGPSPYGQSRRDQTMRPANSPPTPAGSPMGSGTTEPAAPIGLPKKTSAIAEDGLAQATKAGLRINGPVAVNAGLVTEQTLELAKYLQSNVPGFQQFTSLNDSYHRDNKPQSSHVRGQGLDFTLTDPVKKDKAYMEKLVNWLYNTKNVARVKDEYSYPSSKSTGPHMHVGTLAEKGAVLTGPKSGYRPDLTMHGTEAVIPLANGTVPIDPKFARDLVKVIQSELGGSRNLSQGIVDIKTTLDVLLRQAATPPQLTVMVQSSTKEETPAAKQTPIRESTARKSESTTPPPDRAFPMDASLTQNLVKILRNEFGENSRLAGKISEVKTTLDEYLRQTTTPPQLSVTVNDNKELSAANQTPMGDLIERKPEPITPLPNRSLPIDASFTQDLVKSLRQDTATSTSATANDITNLKVGLDNMSRDLGTKVVELSDIQREILTTLREIRQINDVTATASTKMARTAMN